MTSEQRSKRVKAPITLCAECANAFDGCSWAKNGEPVDGWIADENTLCYNRRGWIKETTSYTVYACPQYRPDSKEPTHYSDPCLKTAATLTLAQAIEDWNATERGRLEIKRYCGETILRSDLVEFFRSEFFEDLVAICLPQFSPNDLRKMLGLRPCK